MDSLIYLIQADEQYIDSIENVSRKDNFATYGYFHTKEYIERITNECYSPVRISKEVFASSKD